MSNTPNTLSPELKAQIEKEAEAAGNTLASKIAKMPRCGHIGIDTVVDSYEEGYVAGATAYALKLQQAEEMMEKMAKELRLIEQMSDPGSYERAVYEMKSIASDSLTEYNNYKQTKDGTANG